LLRGSSELDQHHPIPAASADISSLRRHAVLLLCIFRYTLSWIRFNYYGGMAQFCYRLGFISAAATYGIVAYKTWRARQKTGTKLPGGAAAYLADENVQYLGMCAAPSW
jgi:hypothetical protein